MAEEVATRICNFCGLPEHNVSVLIAGPSVFICGECVYLAARITSKAYYDKATRLDKEVEIIEKAETLQEHPNND